MISTIFKYLDFSVDDVNVDKLFVQETEEPYTCYNDRKDGDETDVDCGGESCSARCEGSMLCNESSDCVDSKCFNGKCFGISKMLVKYSN
jgi:hypothetical protein